MKNSLTTGTVWKKLILFAIPILGANLLQALYGTVDLMIVGRFANASAVSAVSTGSMTVQTLIGIVTGLTMGCTVLLGNNIGKKDHKAATRTVASSIALFVVIGLILAFVIPLFAPQLAKMMNAPEEALSETIQYIRICGGGIIFTALFNAFSGMFRGIGDSKTPLILVGIACVFNIFGDFFAVGVLGYGAAGAAFATILAQAVSVISAFLLIKKRGMGFTIEREYLRPYRYEVVTILRYGLPIAAQEALTGVSFMIILAIINSFGLIASAGVGIAEKICGLIFIVPGAIMAAISAFSAQNFGAGEKKRARQGMYVGMGITVAVGLVMFAVSFFKGVWLSGFFSKDLEVCLASADFLKSYSVDCVIFGINFSMMGYLNGKGKTSFVALQGILSTFLVRIPVSYFMSKIPGVSLFQVGFATPLATVFAIVITLLYLKRTEK